MRINHPFSVCIEREQFKISQVNMSYSPESEPTKIYVGGINYCTDEDTLRSQFGHCGNIQEVIIVRERDTGKSKGYGFIKFDHEESAKQAIGSMNGAELDGRNIKVNKAQKPAKPDNAFRGRGGYPGRGRGHFQGGFNNSLGYSTSGAYGGAANYSWPAAGTGYSSYSTGMSYGQYDGYSQGQPSSTGWPSTGSGYGNYGGNFNYNQRGY